MADNGASDDAEELYKDLFDVVIPDLNYFLRQIDCRHGCPVKTDGRGYMMAIHRGDLLEGYKIARGPNPFASICGWICAAPCEISCRRDRVDKTLTIRAQKRYLDEWFGVDEEAHRRSLEYSYARGSTKPEPNGLKIACVGAGVASLTLAHDLLRLGYEVEIFEMNPLPGGMLVYGVPNYRLKNEVAVAECRAIEALGAKVTYNTKVGRDITMTELQRDYDAVFLGHGLWRSRDLPIPGADQPDVIRGVEYLKVLNSGRSWKVGKHVVVIGGGNVAFDVGRSSRRNGTAKVTMVCLESRDEQTADEFEIEDGLEEGITLVNRVGPKAIERDESGKIIGLRVQRIAKLFDFDGRFSPEFIPGTEYVIPCDTVALAIGQSMDASFLEGWDKRDEFKVERGIVACEEGTGRTSIPGVYCAGDAGFGASLFITCIKQAQDCARAIDADLRGTKPYQEFVGEFTQIPPMRDKEYLRTPYSLPSIQQGEKRINNLNIVENPYTDEEVHQQANRCLQCHTSPVFNGELCIKCNGCVDVCPTRCLKLIPLNKLNMEFEEGKMRKAVDNFYGVESEELSEEELSLIGSAMLKDEELCIRCGLCAEKCPTQAVTMDMMNYSFRWVG